jgi:hypothetical protein
MARRVMVEVFCTVSAFVSVPHIGCAHVKHSEKIYSMIKICILVK